MDKVSVVVDGILEGDGPKFNRIQQDGDVSTGTEFTFQNVTRPDQATRLQCYATYAADSNMRPISSEVLLCNVGCECGVSVWLPSVGHA